jgi:hypothetical protein
MQTDAEEEAERLRLEKEEELARYQAEKEKALSQLVSVEVTSV